MDPLTTASLISSGSNLIGGLLGGGGDTNARRYRAGIEAKENQLQYEQDSFHQKMKLGKQHGFHPLAMLGINPANGVSIPAFSGGGSGSNAGQFLAEAGQGISRAVEAYGTKEDRALARVGMGLDIENKKLQNDRLASEIRLMNAPGSPPALPSPGLRGGPASGDLSIKAFPRHVMAVDADGKVVRVLNPDLGDSEALQVHDFFTRTAPDEYRSLVERTMKHRFPNPLELVLGLFGKKLPPRRR